MEYLIHTTREGDRWDLLADYYYTDTRNDRTLFFQILMDANPVVSTPWPPVLAGGLKLRIPILTREEASGVAFQFVPWAATVTG